MISACKKILQTVITQLSIAFAISFIVGTQLVHIVPHGLNSTDWSSFAQDISVYMGLVSVWPKVMLLLTLHTSHLFCYMSMLHITKVLYGYWLGILRGWCLCVAWEMTLFYIFLYSMHREPMEQVQNYVMEMRRRRTFFLEMTVVCISSLPLQTKTLTVAFSDITNTEYLYLNIGPTMLLSFKNVLCGGLLASHPTPQTLVVLSSALALSPLIPTISTVLVSSKSLLFVIQSAQKAHNDVIVGEEHAFDTESGEEGVANRGGSHDPGCTPDKILVNSGNEDNLLKPRQ